MANNKKNEPEPEQNATAPPVYLTVKDIEKALQISRETVRMYMNRREHPLPVMRVGKNGYGLRFNAAKFAQWCAEEEQAQQEEQEQESARLRAWLNKTTDNKRGKK